LTREVIVGLLANLETREERRQDYSTRGLPFEHPRASSTDDVEGFFALLHQMLGPHFDLKQFFDQFPKIMHEFMKKIDPELPFFIGQVKTPDIENLSYHLLTSLPLVVLSTSIG